MEKSGINVGFCKKSLTVYIKYDIIFYTVILRKEKIVDLAALLLEKTDSRQLFSLLDTERL